MKRQRIDDINYSKSTKRKHNLESDSEEEEEEEDDDEEEFQSASNNDADDNNEEDESKSPSIRDMLINAGDDEESILQIIQKYLGDLSQKGSGVDNVTSLNFILACKEKPQIFSTNLIMKYFIRLLRSKDRKETQNTSAVYRQQKDKLIKTGETLKVSVLVCNLLTYSLMSRNLWPIDCIKVYLEDSLVSRSWVDDKMCETFIQKTLKVLEIEAAESIEKTNCNDNKKGLSSLNDDSKKTLKETNDRENIIEMVVKHITCKVNDTKDKGGLGSHYSTGISLRNLLLTLGDLVILPAIRELSGKYMERWLQNPSVKTPAKELLAKVTKSCRTKEPSDFITVDYLLKMKLKSSMSQIQIETILQLVSNCPDYLGRALKQLIIREKQVNLVKGLDNNLKILVTVFKVIQKGSQTYEDVTISPGVSPSRGSTPCSSPLRTEVDSSKSMSSNILLLENSTNIASMELAKAIQELALDKKEMAPILKSLIKKILKALTFDLVDVTSLCIGLVEDRSDLELLSLSEIDRLDYFNLINEILEVILLQFATGYQQPITVITPSIRQNPLKSRLNNVKSIRIPHPLPHQYSSNEGGNTKTKPKGEFIQTIALLQKSFVSFCLNIWKKYCPSLAISSTYYNALQRILFLKEFDSEDLQEKANYLICSEGIPVAEETLRCIVRLGLYDDHPLLRKDALDIIESLIFRAAKGELSKEKIVISTSKTLGIYISQKNIILDILELSVVKNELKQEEEEEEELVKFSHRSLFWRCCLIVLILGSFNPLSVGLFIWEHVPTIRCLLQMLISGLWEYPPVDINDIKLLGTMQGIPSKSSLLELEKKQLEQEEMKINENNEEKEDTSSNLLYDLSSFARCPPGDVIKKLQALDQSLKLGLHLRKCRSPDFLMDMVNGDESHVQNSWWIAATICSEPDTVQYLPYDCICYLTLLAYISATDNQDKRVSTLILQANTLVSRLVEYMQNDEEIAVQIVTFFLQRFTHKSSKTRTVALIALRDIIMCSYDSKHQLELNKKTDKKCFEWITNMQVIRYYNKLESHVIKALQDVLHTETNLDSLESCLLTLKSLWVKNDQVDILSFAVTIGKLLVERSLIMLKLLESPPVHQLICNTLLLAVKEYVYNSPCHPLPSVLLWNIVILNQENQPNDTWIPSFILRGALDLISYPGNIPIESETDWLSLVKIFFPLSSSIVSTSGQIPGLQGVRDFSGTLICNSSHLQLLGNSSNRHLAEVTIQSLELKGVWQMFFSCGLRLHSVIALMERLDNLCRKEEYQKESDLFNTLINAAIEKGLVKKELENEEEKKRDVLTLSIYQLYSLREIFNISLLGKQVEDWIQKIQKFFSLLPSERFHNSITYTSNLLITNLHINKNETVDKELLSTVIEEIPKYEETNITKVNTLDMMDVDKIMDKEVDNIESLILLPLHLQEEKLWNGISNSSIEETEEMCIRLIKESSLSFPLLPILMEILHFIWKKDLTVFSMILFKYKIQNFFFFFNGIFQNQSLDTNFQLINWFLVPKNQLLLFELPNITSKETLERKDELSLEPLVDRLLELAFFPSIKFTWLTSSGLVQLIYLKYLFLQRDEEINEKNRIKKKDFNPLLHHLLPRLLIALQQDNRNIFAVLQFLMQKIEINARNSLLMGLYTLSPSSIQPHLDMLYPGWRSFLDPFTSYRRFHPFSQLENDIRSILLSRNSDPFLHHAVLQISIRHWPLVLKQLSGILVILHQIEQSPSYHKEESLEFLYRILLILNSLRLQLHDNPILKDILLFYFKILKRISYDTKSAILILLIRSLMNFSLLFFDLDFDKACEIFRTEENWKLLHSLENQFSDIETITTIRTILKSSNLLISSEMHTKKILTTVSTSSSLQDLYSNKAILQGVRELPKLKERIDGALAILKILQAKAQKTIQFLIPYFDELLLLIQTKNIPKEILDISYQCILSLLEYDSTKSIQVINCLILALESTCPSLRNAAVENSVCFQQFCTLNSIRTLLLYLFLYGGIKGSEQMKEILEKKWWRKYKCNEKIL